MARCKPHCSQPAAASIRHVRTTAAFGTHRVATQHEEGLVGQPETSCRQGVERLDVVVRDVEVLELGQPSHECGDRCQLVESQADVIKCGISLEVRKLYKPVVVQAQLDQLGVLLKVWTHRKQVVFLGCYMEEEKKGGY